MAKSLMIRRERDALGIDPPLAPPLGWGVILSEGNRSDARVRFTAYRLDPATRCPRRAYIDDCSRVIGH